MKKSILLLSIILLINLLSTNNSNAQYRDSIPYGNNGMTYIIPNANMSDGSTDTVHVENGGPFTFKLSVYDVGLTYINGGSCQGFDSATTNCGPRIYGIAYDKNGVGYLLNFKVEYYVNAIDSTPGSLTYGKTPDTVWTNPTTNLAKLSTGPNFRDNYTNWKEIGGLGKTWTKINTISVSNGKYTVSVYDQDFNISYDTITVLSSCATTTTRTDTICQGSSLIIGSHTYTTAGIYTDSLKNSKGCDSIIITNLSIRTVPAKANKPLGDNFIATGSIITYTTTTTSTATSYSWEIYPANTGTLNNNTLSTSVNFSGTWQGIAKLIVKAGNTCGYGPASDSLNIKVIGDPITIPITDTIKTTVNKYDTIITTKDSSITIIDTNFIIKDSVNYNITTKDSVKLNIKDSIKYNITTKDSVKLNIINKDSTIINYDTTTIPVYINDTIKVIITDTTITGIKFINNSSATLKIYPNPTVSEVTIESTEVLEKIEVFSSAGLLLQTIEPKTKTFTFNNVNNWPNGIVLVKLTIKGQTFSKKLQVLK